MPNWNFYLRHFECNRVYVWCFVSIVLLLRANKIACPSFVHCHVLYSCSHSLQDALY
uniref:Uncharacterized protein n=1 Tax=Arundo donax TaxID=35708 RepID=A0A0A9HGR1_ARUDO